MAVRRTDATSHIEDVEIGRVAKRSLRQLAEHRRLTLGVEVHLLACERERSIFTSPR